MLGKVALLAGAGAAYALRTPEARARFARLLQGADAGAPRSGGAGGRGPGAGPAAELVTGTAAPSLVDRRPQRPTGHGQADAGSAARLLPDARPVEIARAVSEEQPRG